jgi:hypothetical protein
MPKAEPRRFRGYWTRRVRSPAFRRQLAAMLAEELYWVAARKVRDVVDTRRVRQLIEIAAESDLGDRVDELILEAGLASLESLRAKKRSLREVLGADDAAAVEALIAERRVLGRDAERRIGNLMRQKLVRDLLTDIIHASIVSFYKRINPIFGGLAIRAVEGQIKSFIGLFMPMVLDRATGFLVDQRNQEMFADFARSIVRGLLDEPLPRLVSLISTGNPRATRALLRDLQRNPRLRALGRELALTAWDAGYARVRNEKVGAVLPLEENADRLAAEAVELLLPVLVRPHVVTFLESELTLAARHVSERQEEPQVAERFGTGRHLKSR